MILLVFVSLSLVVSFVQLHFLSLESLFSFFAPGQVLGDGDSSQGLDFVLAA